MIGTILAFLGSTLGRYAVIGGGVLAFIGAFAWHQQNIGQKKLVRASIKKGLQINARNEKTRRKVFETPGSAARLPCRDC